MNNPVQVISPLGLGLAFVLMAVAILLIAWERVPLKKELVVGTLRTVGQLLAVGVLLDALFRSNQWYWVLLFLGVMLLVASQTVYQRAGARRQRLRLFLDIGFSLLVGAGLTIFWVTKVVISIHPWYHPQYLIPLAGMIIGNSVNSAALAMERFENELTIRKAEIETLLSLGATAKIAAEACMKSAITAAMIPHINAMMMVGVVSLPGMMTGQILAGQSPLSAVSYQIVVMFMLTCAGAITTVLLLKLALKRHFNTAAQLIF